MPQLAKLFLVGITILSTSAICESPAPIFTFNRPQEVCTLVDNKLVLSRKWPLGNWEDCAYGLLAVAQQLDSNFTAAQKELATQKQLASELQKILEEAKKKK